MSNDELIPGFCGGTPAQHQPDRQPQSRKDMQRRRILRAAGATNADDETRSSLFPSSPHLFLFSFSFLFAVRREHKLHIMDKNKYTEHGSGR